MASRRDECARSRAHSPRFARLRKNEYLRVTNQPTNQRTGCSHRDDFGEKREMQRQRERNTIIIIVIILFTNYSSRLPPPRRRRRSSPLNSPTPSPPNFRSVASSPASSPSKTPKVSATRFLSDTVSRIQSVTFLFASRKSSTRCTSSAGGKRRSKRTPCTDARPTTCRFFSSNTPSDPFRAAFAWTLSVDLSRFGRIQV